MKKLMCVVAMLLTVSMATFGNDNNVNGVSEVSKYNLSTSANSLVRYLDLSKDQVEAVIEIQRSFENAIMMGAAYDNVETRNSFIDNAISYDLRNMGYILTDEQYRKYVRVLNITLKNRNIR